MTVKSDRTRSSSNFVRYGARTTAFLLPIVVAAAFLNLGQSSCCDANDCTPAQCELGMVCQAEICNAVTFQPVGESCDFGGGPGFCDGLGACMESPCSDPDYCDDMNDCTDTVLCEPIGVCVYAPTPQETPCSLVGLNDGECDGAESCGFAAGFVDLPLDGTVVQDIAAPIDFEFFLGTPGAFVQIEAADNVTLQAWDPIGQPVQVGTPTTDFGDYTGFSGATSLVIPDRYWIDSTTGAEARVRAVWTYGDPNVAFTNVDPSPKFIMKTSPDWSPCSQEGLSDRITNCGSEEPLRLVTTGYSPRPVAPAMDEPTELFGACDAIYGGSLPLSGSQFPVDSAANLYRDGSLQHQNQLVSFAGEPVANASLKETYPGQSMEYVYTYTTAAGIESDPSEPALITIPACSVEDRDPLSFADGQMHIAVALVRLQDATDLPPDPRAISDQILEDPHFAVEANMARLSRGAFTPNVDVHYLKVQNELIEVPFPATTAISPDLALDIRDYFINDLWANFPPPVEYDQWIIFVWGSEVPTGVWGAFQDHRLAIIRGSGITASFPAHGYVAHEIVNHNVLKFGHIGGWRCTPSACQSNWVACTSFRSDISQDQCRLGTGSRGMLGPGTSYSFAAPLLERAGFYLPGDIQKVTEAGERLVAHFDSPELPKRLDIDLGGGAAYTFQYVVPPYDTVPRVAVSLKTNGVLRDGSSIHGLAGSSIFDSAHEVISLVEEGTGGSWRLYDPRRGLLFTFVEATDDFARIMFERVPIDDGVN